MRKSNLEKLQDEFGSEMFNADDVSRVLKINANSSHKLCYALKRDKKIKVAGRKKGKFRHITAYTISDKSHAQLAKSPTLKQDGLLEPGEKQKVITLTSPVEMTTDNLHKYYELEYCSVQEVAGLMQKSWSTIKSRLEGMAISIRPNSVQMRLRDKRKHVFVLKQRRVRKAKAVKRKKKAPVQNGHNDPIELARMLMDDPERWEVFCRDNIREACEDYIQKVIELAQKL